MATATSLSIFLVAAFAVLEPVFCGEGLKDKIAEAVPLSVSGFAKTAFPIQFSADDYSGPYDPFDPNGIAAASHRRMKMQGKKSNEFMKSYFPPGLGKVAKKEAVKTAIGEGRRFAIVHPKEAGEILGMATKAKALYNRVSHKLKSLEDGKN